MKKLLSLFLCIAVAVTATSAQTTPVLDTSGEPLQRGVAYRIRPAAAGDGGPVAAVSRTSPISCPLYVGQVDPAVGTGGVFSFAPFAADDGTVFVGRDLKVALVGPTPCVGNATWWLDGRLIEAAEGGGSVDDGNEYFFIGGAEEGGYVIGWCPVEYCAPECSPPFRCAEIGSVVVDGTRLLADTFNNSPPLRVVFERANN